MKAILVSFYILVILIAAGTASVFWTIEILDSEGCTGYWTSIQIVRPSERDFLTN